MHRTFTSLVVLCAVGLAACTRDDGPRTTQARDVAPFSRVDNRDSVDVLLTVGAPQRVRVRAGREVVDDVRTEVRGETLHVTFDDAGGGFGDLGESEVVVEATVPTLLSIASSGSGDVDAGDIDARAFEVRSSGSGDVTLEGAVEMLAASLDGSGDADLARLVARAARVIVTGSGDLDVNAADRLDVVVDGSGDVRYYGSPRLTRRVDGSGDLRRR